MVNGEPATGTLPHLFLGLVVQQIEFAKADWATAP